MRQKIVLGSIMTALALSACNDDDGQFVEVPVVELVDFFDPCAFDDQCPVGTFCEDIEVDYGDVVVVDAMCTVACGSDLDCPLDGLCLGAASGPPLCYEPCFDDFDCPIGFGCVQDVRDVFFEPVCLPI